jgi:hypothetical protein
MVFSGILAIGVSFGVVDMLGGKVDTKSIGGHFEFMGGISVSLEGLFTIVVRAYDK